MNELAKLDEPQPQVPDDSEIADLRDKQEVSLLDLVVLLLKYKLLLLGLPVAAAAAAACG